jgi:hypothetical protein
MEGPEDEPRPVDQDQVQLLRRGINRNITRNVPGTTVPWDAVRGNNINVRWRGPLPGSGHTGASNTGT